MRPVRLAFQIVEEIASHQPIGATELAGAGQSFKNNGSSFTDEPARVGLD